MSTIGTELKTTGVAEVIVVLDPQQQLAAASAQEVERSLARHFSGSELSQRSAIIEDGFVNAASPSRQPALPVPTTSLRRRARSQPAATEMRYFKNLGICYGIVDRAGLAALRADPDVRSVSGAPQLRLIRPTKKVRASLSRNVTWGIDALGIPELWDEGLSGKGVVVAHLDTGVDGKHPTMKGALAGFVEIDRLGFPVAGAKKAFDTDDHGTHTAATIAGRPEPRTGRCVGVAPGAKLASAIVIEGGQTVARVLAGMDWALGQGAQVLSMSLGFPGYVDDFLTVTKVLRERGMLPVIAAGNEGPGTSRSPGNYAEALSVGWSDRDRAVDPESSSQRFRRRTQPVVPDLVAPGGDIVSAKPGGGYQLMSGTSMATPHIAGLAALFWEAKPAATVKDIERAIFSSCELLPGVSESRQGRGLPNGPRGLRRLVS